MGKHRWRVLDLFSGIGAFSLGLERAGASVTAFSEIDEFCSDVLRQHWPDVPNLGDIRHAKFPPADAIAGGFPCQDVSRAGGRAGLAGRNTGLFWELVRALRLVRPKIALLENVAALLDDGMGTVLGELAESGFDTEWDCVPAQAIGACHERDRVWIVAHPDSDGRRPGSGGEAARAWDQSCRRAAPPVTDASGVRCGPGLGAEEHGRQAPRGREWTWAETPDDDVAIPAFLRRREGGPGRPPDSFARVRDEARRNAADAYGARLAFGACFRDHARGERTAAQRDPVEAVGQSIWPDEPALQGVDDGTSEELDKEDWSDRVRATGNTLIPLIPELIMRSVMDQYDAA